MNKVKLFQEVNEKIKDDVETYIVCEVNSIDYRFLLDTGAAKSSMIIDASSLEFEYVGQKEAGGAFSSRIYDEVMVDEFEIGKKIIKNFRINIARNPNENMKNIVGMDVFKFYKVIFSLKDGELSFIESEVGNERAELFELEMGRNYHPYVDMQFDDLKAKCLWDTGASITVVDNKFVKENPSLFHREGNEVGVDSTGASSDSDIYVMSSYEINGQKFNGHRVASIDLSHINERADIKMDMIIGYPTISQKVWYFDFPNKKWCFI